MTIKNHIFPDGNRTIFWVTENTRGENHIIRSITWPYLGGFTLSCWTQPWHVVDYISHFISTISHGITPSNTHFFQFYIFNCIQHAHRLGGKSTSLSTNPSKISRWLHSVVARVSLNIPGILGGFQGSLLVNPRLQWTLVPIQSLKIVCLGIHEMIHSPCGKL